MSSPFREQVQRDIANIFLNPSELGQEVIWNGYPVMRVEDANIPLEAQYAQGVDIEIRRLVCSSEALSPHPVSYEEVLIDSEYWLVREVKKPPGFLLITLERRRG